MNSEALRNLGQNLSRNKVATGVRLFAAGTAVAGALAGVSAGRVAAAGLVVGVLEYSKVPITPVNADTPTARQAQMVSIEPSTVEQSADDLNFCEQKHFDLFPSDSFFSLITPADFNGDGLNDAYGNPISDVLQEIFVQNPYTHNFEPQPYTTDKPLDQGEKIVDYNRDGKSDILCIPYPYSLPNDEITIAIQEGPLVFKTLTYKTNSKERLLDAELGDLNNDGMYDLIWSDYPHSPPYIKRIYVAYGLPGQKFSPKPIIMAEEQIQEYYKEIIAADVNGDGKDDLIVGANFSDGHISIFESPCFIRRDINNFNADIDGNDISITVYDVDRDGIKDIVVPIRHGFTASPGDDSGTVAIIWGGDFAVSELPSDNLPKLPYQSIFSGTSVANFTNDIATHIIGSTWDNSVVIWTVYGRNSGEPQIIDRSNFVKDRNGCIFGPPSTPINSLDMNGDGWPDIVTGNNSVGSANMCILYFCPADPESNHIPLPTLNPRSTGTPIICPTQTPTMTERPTRRVSATATLTPTKIPDNVRTDVYLPDVLKWVFVRDN